MINPNTTSTLGHENTHNSTRSVIQQDDSESKPIPLSENQHFNYLYLSDDAIGEIL